MTDIDRLRQLHRRTFILVCSNFIMFLLLFMALGFVAWQSATLISELQRDLAKAEQAVVQLRQKIEHTNVDALMDKVIASAGESIVSSIRTEISQTDFGASFTHLGEKVENSHAKLERISQDLEEANDKLQKLDTAQLAQLASYYVLIGLGEAFTDAAEAKRPSSMPGVPNKSSVAQ